MQLTSDQITDSNPNIYVHTSRLGIVPDYVQDGDVLAVEDVQKLANVAFADPERRLLPLSTKVACWMSAAYAAGKGVDDEKIWENITKMAAAYEISEDVETVRQAFAETIKQAAAAAPSFEKYAMVVDFGGFQGRGLEGYYPIDSEHAVVASAVSLHDDYRDGRVAEPWYYSAAGKICKAASAFGVDLRDININTWDAGQERVVDIVGKDDPAVRLRKIAGYDTTAHEAILEKAASDAAPMTTQDELQKLASSTLEALCAADADVGIYAYSETLPSPYHSVYGATTLAQLEKAAATTLCIAGVPVPASELCRMEDQTIEDNFRTDVADAIKQARTLAGTETVENMREANAVIDALGTGIAETLLEQLVAL